MAGLELTTPVRSYRSVFKQLLLLSLILGLVPPSHAAESAKVIRIVDGDTIRVHYKGKEEAVRLIGIDTPETEKKRQARFNQNLSLFYNAQGFARKEIGCG